MKLRTDPSAVCVTTLCAALLAGCSSITGLDGSSQYACKAPEGVKCDSVSGNYYNALQNNLPAQRKTTGARSPSGLPEPQGAPAVRSTARSGPASMPCRSRQTAAPPAQADAAPSAPSADSGRE